MNLPDIKHLDKIIQLCRKRGVKSIKIDNIELTLGEQEPKRTRSSKKKQENQGFSVADDQFESDSLTQEQMLMWSVANTADGEPANTIGE